MRGSIYKRGKTYTYVIDIGKVNGTRKQKSKGGFRTKKEADKALADVISTLQTEGSIYEITKISYSDLYHEFIKYEGPSKRSSTIVKYNSIFNNHLKPLIGGKYIHTITPELISDYLLSLGLSASYITSIRNQLIAVFNYALRKEYIKDSPISKIRLPKTKKEEIIIYSYDELELIYSRLKSTNQQPAFFIGLNTGMRAGEVYALTWSDIDFSKRKIRVNKQLQRENKTWCFTEPKTDNSYRSIDISELLLDHLKALKRNQKKARLALASFYIDSKIVNKLGANEFVDQPDFVIRKPDGEMLNTNSHKVISRICKEELSIDFKFHNLRHTHASILLDQNYTIQYVYKRLGHARPSITWDTYSHLIPNQDIDLSKLDNILANTLNLR